MSNSKQHINTDEVTILIVEDSAIQAEFLKRKLLAQDYQIIMAVDGQQGLQMIESERPSLVLSDVNMPIMNGLELCREVKSNQDLKKTKFIM
ncbi:MAG: response regulator, partial [Gammaproteobacteria bacterium]|nr:response regulator [Gammaproteobacteria bacterium]